MVAETTVLGVDVSRDWLDGFCLPDEKRFRYPNTADGHNALVAMIQQLSGPMKVGFEATGGHEWVLWTELSAAGIVAVQLSPAQSEPSGRHAFESCPSWRHRFEHDGRRRTHSRFPGERGRRRTGSTPN